jgi:nucleotide-binding universal stress UspA family protein
LRLSGLVTTGFDHWGMLMAYRDLLLHLDDSKGCAKRVEAAVQLAARHGAHLTGFWPIVEIPLLGYIKEQIPAEIQANIAAEAKARADAGLTAFGKAAERAGVAHETRIDHALDTTTASVVSMHARYADLVVLGQADPEDPPHVSRHLHEQVVLSSGRPVLLIPYIGAPATIGQRIVIAWDASREAARAVSDAMPMLNQAASVFVMSINPKTTPLGHGELPGTDIGAHLARHNLKVEVELVTAGELSVADALLSHIADRGADLLVMGGYAHSRVRELVLGGVTRTILESMPVPVLMAH